MTLSRKVRGQVLHGQYPRVAAGAQVPRRLSELLDLPPDLAALLTLLDGNSP